MKSIQLPKESSTSKESLIEVHNYLNPVYIAKQEITLTKHTFSFLLEGQKEVITKNSTFRIDNNQFLLMKSGNCLMTEKPLNSTNQFNSVLLFFTNEELFEIIQKHNIKITPNDIPLSISPFFFDHYTKLFVESLKTIQNLSFETKNKIQKIKLEELILYLLEKNGPQFISSLVSSEETNASKFNNIIESNKLIKLSVKELAFISNMSISSFKREFFHHYKTTPNKWFLNKRLEYAAHLLKIEGKRPSDIYDEVGYENPSNFIHAFKHKFGVTPKQFQSN